MKNKKKKEKHPPTKGKCNIYNKHIIHAKENETQEEKPQWTVWWGELNEVGV